MSVGGQGGEEGLMSVHEEPGYDARAAVMEKFQVEGLA